MDGLPGGLRLPSLRLRRDRARIAGEARARTDRTGGFNSFIELVIRSTIISKSTKEFETPVRSVRALTLAPLATALRWIPPQDLSRSQVSGEARLWSGIRQGKGAHGLGLELPALPGTGAAEECRVGGAAADSGIQVLLLSLALLSRWFRMCQ